MLIAALTAQQPALPTIRPIGPIERVSKDSLSSVAFAIPLGNGSVYVDDIGARRILLFDSTLAHGVVVADSTGSAANAYGNRAGALLPFRGDSVILVSSGTMSLQVLSPTGTFARTMALPASSGNWIGIVGSAGFDGQGRLLFLMQARVPTPAAMKAGGPWIMQSPDSSFVVRFDLAKRSLDTLAAVRVARHRTVLTRLPSGAMSYALTAYPVEVVDEWAVLPDGRVAIVRGRDYHVEWLGNDGQWSSTAKMAFDWQHLDDSAKRFLIDSTAARLKFWNDSMMDAMEARAGGGGGPSAGGGRGPAKPPRPAFLGAELADVPDYRPAFGTGAVRPDGDGNLWILTGADMGKGVVYDVVGAHGQVVDRVRVPAKRVVAGFGPGVAYMAVIDSQQVVHLERARIK